MFLIIDGSIFFFNQFGNRIISSNECLCPSTPEEDDTSAKFCIFGLETGLWTHSDSSSGRCFKRVKYIEKVNIYIWQIYIYWHINAGILDWLQSGLSLVWAAHTGLGYRCLAVGIHQLLLMQALQMQQLSAERPATPASRAKEKQLVNRHSQKCIRKQRPENRCKAKIKQKFKRTCLSVTV